MLLAFLWFWSAILIFASTTTYAATTIHLLLSGTSPYYQETVKAIRATVEAEHPSVVIVQLTENGDYSLPEIEPDSLIISVGTQSASAAINHFPDNPLLALFITRQAWNEIVETATPTQAVTQSKQAAIFIDQPLERYLALGQLLLPKASTYSTVLGPSSVDRKAELMELSETTGKTIHFAEMSLASNPLAVLTPLISNSELFIAFPDQAIFNRNIAKWALYLSYQYKVPVIGFSSSYSKAGAVASIFSSPTDVADDASDWLRLYLRGHNSTLWGPHDPKYYTVDINRSVARVLNISAPRHNDLPQHLEKLIQSWSRP